MGKPVCFVCQNSYSKEVMVMNDKVLLPVCPKCIHTDNEKKKEEEYLDSLAEGFVCGCI